ncbi:MAG TPA: hypothetical protein PLZ78_08940 [Spirochaetota bacterium]|nr:hypothetical protein [Spirochaetota bacterium]
MGSSNDEQKEIVPVQVGPTPEQQAASSRAMQVANKPFEPFEGQRFAQYPYKERLASSLESYMNRGTSPLLDLASGEYSKTLSGQYDPFESPYYQATKQGALRNEQEAINRFKRAQNIRGMFNSAGTDQGTANIVTNTTNQLNTLAGKLAEAERARRLGAAGPAASLADLISKQPLDTASAISSISPILKSIEQEPMDFAYQELLRKQAQEQQQGALAASLIGAMSPTYRYPVYSTPPNNGGLLGLMGGGLGSVAGGYASGWNPMGMMAGYGIGSGLGQGVGSFF